MVITNTWFKGLRNCRSWSFWLCW